MKIVSDGTALGTQVFDADGNQIGLVQKVTWEVSVDQPYAKMIVEVFGVPSNLVAEGAVLKTTGFYKTGETTESIRTDAVNSFWDKVNSTEDLDNLLLGKIKEESEKEEAEKEEVK